MFTIEDIKAEHSKVKSGADFPKYIQGIKKLGVLSYEAYVSDGHINYLGENNQTANNAAKYDALKIEEKSNKDQFIADLKAHQQGKTDYLTFCNDCAKSGIEKWVVDLNKMTCIYYDISKNEILVEQIPS